MSDEFLVINTTDGLIKPKQLTPLTLYDENFSMLNQRLQDYVGQLPNVEMDNFIERMKMTMKKFAGIGLSANQCGVDARIFVIGHEDFVLTCINPKVIAQSEEMVKLDEGCLSFPGLFCKIERPKWIEAEFTNQKGELVQMKLEGLTARCYMHELDHMNGVKFTSYVKPLALKLARDKQQKRIKNAVRKSK